MATLLFTPLAMLGHINPTFRAARELQQRGHRVVYAGVPDAEEFVRRAGFEFQVLLADLWPAGSRQRILERCEADSPLERLRGEFALKRYYDNYHEALLRGDVDGVLARLQPDLLVCDTLMCPLAIIAHGLGIPTLLFNAAFPLRDEYAEPPVTSGLIPDGRLTTRARIALLWTGLRLRARLGDVGEWLRIDPRRRDCMRRLALKHGLPLERLELYGDAPLIQVPELVPCAREFVEFSAAPRRGQYLYVEPCIDHERAEADFPLSRLEGKGPVIYMTMGSMQHAPWMTQRYFERGAGIAALRPDWHVVMAAGQQPIPSGLDQSRPNLSVRAYVPQLKLLRRASAVVNHGGFNTVKEALCFGVPMVVLPTQSEQPGIAARVEYHGLGRRASMERATPAELVALLDEVMTRPEYRRAAQAMGGRLRDMERTASIADTLESYLSTTRAASRAHA